MYIRTLSSVRGHVYNRYGTFNRILNRCSWSVTRVKIDLYRVAATGYARFEWPVTGCTKLKSYSTPPPHPDTGRYSPFLYFVSGVVHERRTVERHLIAVRWGVAVFVADALVPVENRYALDAVTARFGNARMRTVGHVRSGKRSPDYLQRSLVDNHLCGKIKKS